MAYNEVYFSYTSTYVNLADNALENYTNSIIKVVENTALQILKNFN